MRRTNSTSSSSRRSSWYSLLNRPNSSQPHDVDMVHNPLPSQVDLSSTGVYGGSPYDNLSVSIIGGRTPLRTPVVSPEGTTESLASRSIRYQSFRQGNVSSSEHNHDSYQTVSTINTNKDLPTPPPIDIAPSNRVDDEEEYYERGPAGSTPSIIRLYYEKRTAIIFLPKDYKGLNHVTKQVFQLPETFDLLFSTQLEAFGENSVELDTEVWPAIKNQITKVWASENPDSFIEVSLIRWGATEPDIVKPKLTRWTTGAQLMALYPGKFMYRYVEGAKRWKLYQNNDKLMDFCVGQAVTVCYSAKEIPPNNVLARQTQCNAFLIAVCGRSPPPSYVSRPIDSIVSNRNSRLTLNDNRDRHSQTSSVSANDSPPTFVSRSIVSQLSEWDERSISHRSRSPFGQFLSSNADNQPTSDAHSIVSSISDREIQYAAHNNTLFVIRLHYENQSVMTFSPIEYTGLVDAAKRAFPLGEDVSLSFPAEIPPFGQGKAEIFPEVWPAIRRQVTQVWATKIRHTTTFISGIPQLQPQPHDQSPASAGISPLLRGMQHKVWHGPDLTEGRRGLRIARPPTISAEIVPCLSLPSPFVACQFAP